MHLAEMLACAAMVAAAYRRAGPHGLLESLDLTWPFLAVLFPLYYLLEHRAGLFRSLRLKSIWRTGVQVARCYLVAMSLSLTAMVALRAPSARRPFELLVAALLGGAVVLSYNVLCWHSLRLLRSLGHDRKRAVSVGINQRTQQLQELLGRYPELGVTLVGAFDEPSRRELCGDLPYLGGLEEVEAYVRGHVVDMVIVVLPMRSFYDRIREVAETCRQAGIEIRYDLRPTDRPPEAVQEARLADLAFVDDPLSPDPTQLLFKRLMDVAGGLLLLLAMGPLMLLTAMAIWAAMGRPILFCQQRVGHHGRVFTMLKFRTMVRHAQAQRASLEALNETDGPVFKIHSDPRVTSLGRWLRRYSVDELPQLVNILCGHMSLVGPRPPLASEVDQYQWQWRRRLSVRPGLTGLWQVSGRNDLATFDQWIAKDLEYVDKWSLLLDVKILLLTIPAVVLRRGAY